MHLLVTRRKGSKLQFNHMADRNWWQICHRACIAFARVQNLRNHALTLTRRLEFRQGYSRGKASTCHGNDAAQSERVVQRKVMPWP